MRALHAAHYKGVREPLLLVSPNVEKALDRVSWHFLLSVLRHVRIGHYRMVAWIEGLYSVPTALVRVNGSISPAFTVRNGKRPLSPLFFVPTLEPFLRLGGVPRFAGYHYPLVLR